MYRVVDLDKETAKIYPNGVDPSAGKKIYYKKGDPLNGKVLDAFAYTKTTIEDLLDNIDLKLEWYIPSDHAIEFMIFIRLVLGEEPENTSPPAHYFFMDCLFNQPNVKPFFMARNIDYDNLKNRVAILASREFSKALCMDTEISTPNGYKTIGELRVGDKVMTRNGKPTKIIRKSKMFFGPEHNTYKMALEDGREALVSRDHLHILWKQHSGHFPEQASGRSYYSPSGMKEVVMDTQDLLNEGILRNRTKGDKHRKGTESKFFIPRMANPVEYDAVDCPIDPYTLGLILGDGSIDKNTGSVQITAHKSDFMEYASNIPYKISNVYCKKGQEHICFFSILGIGNLIKKYVGTGTYYTKRIPADLLHGSVKQRTMLLQGLMDIGGTINKRGSMSFSTTSEGLAKDVQQLVWSLGGKAPIKEYSTSSEFGKVFVVTVGLNNIQVFRLPRKLNRVTYVPDRDYSAVISLELVHTVPMQCITVEDPSASFLLKNGIVTHNSTLIVYLILFMATKGEMPGFGKVLYGIYVSDSMRNGVETTMTTIRKVFLESVYLQDRFEDARLIQTEVNFVRKPRTKKEIDVYNHHVVELKKSPDTVPGRMKRTFSLTGVGANTGSRGKRDGLARPDFSIFDDLISSEVDASSETIMHNIESTIEADVLPGMNNNGNFSIMIGTPYNANDNIYRRIETGTWLPVVFPRAESMPTGTKEEFVSVWEDRHSYENCKRDYDRALKAKEFGDPSPMRRLMQEHYLRIASESDKLVPESIIQWYERKMLVEVLDNYSIYITTDFTTTSDSTSDFCSILVWAISSNDDFYLLDAVVQKLDITTQYSTLFRMVVVWGVNRGKYINVGVEVDGQQKAHLFALKQLMIKKGVYFSFAKQRGASSSREGILSASSGNKFERFQYFLPNFTNHKVFFPHELKNTPDMQEALKELSLVTYKGFTSKHDDFLDALSQLAFIEYLPGGGSSFTYTDANSGLVADGAIFDDPYGSKSSKSKRKNFNSSVIF